MVSLPLERETQGPICVWRVRGRLMLLCSLNSAVHMAHSVYLPVKTNGVNNEAV